MTIDFGFIGWCRDEEKNHDKVWGIIYLEPIDLSRSRFGHSHPSRKCITFWGRRGKKLQSKLSTESDARSNVWKKTDKGYAEIDQTKLNEIYPEFEKDLQKLAMWSMLKY